MGARLVRDRIGDRPWRFEESKQGLRSVRDSFEHEWLLRQKVIEEAAELIMAQSTAQVIEEAADVIELVLAIVERWGGDVDDVERRRLEKLDQLGGFTEGIVWET